MNNTLLVGIGNMGKEYCKVLKAMNEAFVVIGRGKDNANSFREITGVEPLLGGVEYSFDLLKIKPTHAIVAVGDYELYGVTTFLLKKGINKILVEKPGGTSKEQIKNLAMLAKKENADVFVGYNRRHYSSVNRALEIIEEDGGVKSFSFEFTEWMHLFDGREHKGNIEQVLYGNSGHVIDLAFFFGGLPAEISSYTSEKLSWDGSNRAFAGSGITERGALFSYQANWDAPGRWGIEVMTNAHRLIFRPLEELHIQEKRSVKIEKVDLDNSLDVDFKPGLYSEVKSFLYNDISEKTVTIGRQLKNWGIFEKIEGI